MMMKTIDNSMTGGVITKEYELTEEVLIKIRELARLRYTITQIALIVSIPVMEFRRMAAMPGSPVFNAYQAGKLESSVKYRETVHRLAEAGEEWAIHMQNKWEADQNKEELGFNG